LRVHQQQFEAHPPTDRGHLIAHERFRESHGEYLNLLRAGVTPSTEPVGAHGS
jgi:hypothetical protein